jgi:hypothetical protein
MKIQSAAKEISDFRNQCEELVKLVDTFKEDNTRKLYDMLVNTDRGRKKQREVD